MKKINMKIYQNITALIVYIIATPMVVILGLVKLILGALAIIYQRLLFPKTYHTKDEWNFIGKYGKFLQSIMEEM